MYYYPRKTEEVYGGKWTMPKNLALVMSIILLSFLLWFLVTFEYDQFATIDGQMITGPAGANLGAVFTTVVLFCVAILLVFVFVGVGLILISCLVLTGFILTVVYLPFLLPILLPLLVVWVVCILVGRAKTTK